MKKKLALCILSVFLALPIRMSYCQTGTGVPAFKKVMIVVLENESDSEAMGHPFLKKLANEGASTSEFYAVARPSQPNYIAMIGGDTFGIISNLNTNLSAPSIVDLLEAKGKTWKVYAEQYPGNCFTGAKHGRYVRKHNPFISFRGVQNDPRRCTNIVEAAQLERDIQTENLPDYSFYVPDLDNDGHDTGIGFADKWLSQTFGPKLTDAHFMNGMLLVVTFDEGAPTNQHIYTSFYGDLVKPGFRSKIKYDHYSLLKTIEVGFGLGSLGRKDQNAAVITDIWK